MSIIKYALPLLAAANVAIAQSCSASTTTIQNQGDASAVAACTTFSGSVAVATGAPSMLSFDGELTTITEDFTIVNASNLDSLSAGSLQKVGGMFRMFGLTTLSSLTMPDLSQVDDLRWQTLPALQGITFGSFETASNIFIQDTAIQKLDQLNVKMANTINVANNQFLTSIDWDITNCTGAFNVNSNNANGGLTASFSSLQSVGGLFVSNVSSLELGALSNVNGSLAVSGSSIKSLACPNLTMTTNGLTISNNQQLTNISFPMLKEDNGNVAVINNNNLGGVLTFPALTTIRGALNCTGSFSGLSIPKLNLLQGQSTVVSTKSLGKTCAAFGPGGSLVSSGVIRAKKSTCRGATKSSNNNNNDDSSSSSSSGGGSGSSSSSAARRLEGAFASTGILGVFAAVLGMF
ncbi:MAG: hypothetical protein M1828_002851 [Chrysothrix sp. TS-e1954]|nr:MAG: hypothetical protein M1828_002851 [Chrysothrix sp. TS-e1954]